MEYIGINIKKDCQTKVQAVSFIYKICVGAISG